jgi:predicted tellurium resistance membrane protein TerC
MTDFAFIFTAAGTAALIKIIIIDIVMSGDNAILIGMATKKLK